MKRVFVSLSFVLVFVLSFILLSDIKVSAANVEYANFFPAAMIEDIDPRGEMTIIQNTSTRKKYKLKLNTGGVYYYDKYNSNRYTSFNILWAFYDVNTNGRTYFCLTTTEPTSSTIYDDCLISYVYDGDAEFYYLYWVRQSGTDKPMRFMLNSFNPDTVDWEMVFSHFFDSRTVSEDYTNGFTVGKREGINQVVNDPGEYDLYSSTDYRNYGSARYAAGYAAGTSGDTIFKKLIGTVFDTPMNYLFGSYDSVSQTRVGGLFNLNLLGVNLSGFLAAALSVSLCIAVIRKLF